MTDNVVLNPSAGGETVASDEIGGFHHQRVKMEFGGDGTATEVKHASPLPVAQDTRHMDLLQQILAEMKMMNTQLASITGDEITPT
jgi:hypothetical protein